MVRKTFGENCIEMIALVALGISLALAIAGNDAARAWTPATPRVRTIASPSHSPSMRQSPVDPHSV